MYAMQHESQRMAHLGYLTRVLHAVEVIAAPHCDVPAGDFMMGSDPAEDPAAPADERPQHRLALPAFAIMRFPVTVAEYECYVRVGGSEPREWQAQSARLDHPATHITWHDAAAYARWLASVTGQSWRLPNEAEWEKAARWDAAPCRARIYPWGECFDPSRANTSESDLGATTPVGTYPGSASPCGAEEMAGNVWEWTRSVPRAYPFQPDVEGGVPAELARHILRGGSFMRDQRSARAAARYAHVVGGSLADVGFRLVCVGGPQG